MPAAIGEYARRVPIIAILPVKSFHSGKVRLAGSLSPEGRDALGRALALRVLSTTEAAGFIPVVVTGDDRVSSWAASLGVPALTDQGAGLSAAAAVGVDWAEATRSPWLVLHSDLPLLLASDLAPLADALASGRETIAPSSDGGTSALGGRRRISFAYGEGSFSAHLGRLNDPVIVTSLGLLHDLDTPDDLESVVRHPRGSWVGPILP